MTLVKISTIGMSRAAWLKERQNALGGSDAACIVGLSKYRTAFDVYADKKGIAPEKPDNEAMRQGRDLEEYVARRFTETTGKRVRRENAMLYNPSYPFAHANIDRAVIGERAGLECKTTQVLNMHRFKNGEFPDEYYVQCMHYLMVTGWERWYLAVLIYGTEFKIFTLERDEDEIAALAEAEKAFWNNNIIKNVPPSPAGTDTTEQTIKSLFPAGTDDKVTDLAGFNSELKRLSEIKGFIKQFETEKKALEQKIKLFMGECSYGTSNTYRVTWKNQRRTAYNTQKLIADFVPDDTDLSEYTNTTTFRKFDIKEI